jgi:hypothetical protein
VGLPPSVRRPVATPESAIYRVSVQSADYAARSAAVPRQAVTCSPTAVFPEVMGCAGRPSGFQGQFLIMPMLVAVEDRG